MNDDYDPAEARRLAEAAWDNRGEKFDVVVLGDATASAAFLQYLTIPRMLRLAQKVELW